MKSKNLYFLMALSICTSSCATNRQSILGMSLGFGLAGGAVEAARAPVGESKNTHFLLGAGIAGLAGALVGLIMFDEQKAHEKTKEELALNSAELQSCKEGELNASHKQNTLNEGAELPLNLKTMLHNGSGRFSKIDRWIDSGGGELIHQDQKIELIPVQK